MHHVQSPEGFWRCKGEAAKCQSKELVNLEMEVISLEPRAFVIKDFFSDFEADWVIGDKKRFKQIRAVIEYSKN